MPCFVPKLVKLCSLIPTRRNRYILTRLQKHNHHLKSCLGLLSFQLISFLFRLKTDGCDNRRTYLRCKQQRLKPGSVPTGAHVSKKPHLWVTVSSCRPSAYKPVLDILTSDSNAPLACERAGAVT